jgi:hypothetical protein
MDLNDLIPPSPWTLYTAAGINNAGQIVGAASYSFECSPCRAYLLTPDNGGSPQRGAHFHSQAALAVALPHEPQAIVQTTTISAPPLPTPLPQLQVMETQSGPKPNAEPMPMSLAAARHPHDAVFEITGDPLLILWS